MALRCQAILSRIYLSGPFAWFLHFSLVIVGPFPTRCGLNFVVQAFAADWRLLFIYW